MVMKQREQIKEARRFYRNWVYQFLPGTLEDKEELYNRLMKAYLRGYYDALENTMEAVSDIKEEAC